MARRGRGGARSALKATLLLYENESISLPPLCEAQRVCHTQEKEGCGHFLVLEMNAGGMGK